MTRPVGVLDPAPPKGCCCVESLTNPVHSVQFTNRPGRTTAAITFPLWAPTWSNLAVLSSIFVHLVHPGSYLAPTWSIFAPILAQLSANLAHLGPIFAQLGSNLVQFWSQLGPTWSQNLIKMSFKRCFLASPSDLQFSIDF